VPDARTAIRVALFPDSLHEVNGVANTLPQLRRLCTAHRLSMLLVSATDREGLSQDGSVTRLDSSAERFRSPSKRSSLRSALCRYYRRVVEGLREFNPDVVHITA